MNDWYAGASGVCALRAQKELLRRSLSPRRRAGRTLLEIRCGEGLFLRLLRSVGFDVTAVEADAQRRRSAAARESRASILCATATALPFDDMTFDHVLLHLDGGDIGQLNASLQEAFRVARVGLMVTFWNSFSVPWLCHWLRGHPHPWPERCSNWWQVWQALKALRGGRLSAASILLSPEGFWTTRTGQGAALLGRLLPPLGAWSVLLLDMVPLPPVTPLPLRLRQPILGQPEPALESRDVSLLSHPWPCAGAECRPERNLR